MKRGNRRLSEKRGYLQLLWLHVLVSVNLSVFCYANLGVVLNFRHPSMQWLTQKKWLSNLPSGGLPSEGLLLAEPSPQWCQVFSGHCQLWSHSHLSQQWDSWEVSGANWDSLWNFIGELEGIHCLLLQVGELPAAITVRASSSSHLHGVLTFAFPLSLSSFYLDVTIHGFIFTIIMSKHRNAHSSVQLIQYFYCLYKWYNFCLRCTLGSSSALTSHFPNVTATWGRNLVLKLPKYSHCTFHIAQCPDNCWLRHLLRFGLLGVALLYVRTLWSLTDIKVT